MSEYKAPQRDMRFVLNEVLNVSQLKSLLRDSLSPHLPAAQKDMRIVTVPGALEIPLTLKKMAQRGKYDALIALGAVIRGETYHFEIVSNESSRGITEVQLATGVPIANGILTTESDEQAESRMAQKGLDCAIAAIEMARLLPRL